MVAVAAGLLFMAAWLFSPQHGLLRTLASRARLAVRIAGDDLLGLLYRVEERKLEQAAREAPALVAERMGMTWSMAYAERRQKVAIFVSKQDHCLYDLLLRHRAGELHGDISLIISNHEAAKPIAESL